jgi:hypothetical protein
VRQLRSHDARRGPVLPRMRHLATHEHRTAHRLDPCRRPLTDRGDAAPRTGAIATARARSTCACTRSPDLVRDHATGRHGATRLSGRSTHGAADLAPDGAASGARLRAARR